MLVSERAGEEASVRISQTAVRFAPGCRADALFSLACARAMVEPPDLIPHRSTRLSLDTKYPIEDIKLRGFIGHSRREPKNPYFSIRITNERIKLITF